MPKEQPKIETKEKRPKHEIELGKRPEPQKGELYDKWIERIGGPDVKLLESLKEYKAPKSKEKTPLIINRNGNFVLNSENIGAYFDKEKIDAEIEKKNPNARFVKTKNQYQLKKELFKNPELYFHVIGEELKKKRRIVAEKGFGNSIEKWIKELKGEKAEEKPGEKPKEEKAKKEPKKEKKLSEAKSAEGGPPTLDEQIVAKQKELEKVERKHNIYYSPVVKDLLGLYYDKRLKDLKGELKELKRGKPKEKAKEEIKEPKTLPEEVLERPSIKDYLNHIKETDKLFTDMALVRGKVKRKELKPEEYERAKAKWRDAFRKTLDMESGFDPKTIDKIIIIREKERKKKKRPLALLKKIWKAFWNLITKKFGKETIEEVKRDALEQQLLAVKNRIREGGVLGRATLEKEQKRLEKRLKKIE